MQRPHSIVQSCWNLGLRGNSETYVVSLGVGNLPSSALGAQEGRTFGDTRPVGLDGSMLMCWGAEGVSLGQSPAVMDGVGTYASEMEPLKNNFCIEEICTHTPILNFLQLLAIFSTKFGVFSGLTGARRKHGSMASSWKPCPAKPGF